MRTIFRMLSFLLLLEACYETSLHIRLLFVMDWIRNIRILRRPDGNLALWSTIVNEFVYTNITYTFAYQWAVKYALSEYHIRMRFLRKKQYYGENPIKVACREHRGVVSSIGHFLTIMHRVRCGKFSHLYKDHPLTYEEAVELRKHGKS